MDGGVTEPAMTTNIYTLPDEILVMVAEFLVSAPDIAVLARTSHRFHAVAASTRHPTRSLLCACRCGDAAAVSRLLAG
ncbi:hypothetical protein LCGC14_1751940, partial [marine sediment metagenome]